MAEAISYVEGQHNTITAIVEHVLFKKTLPNAWHQWMLEMGLWHLRELKLDTWQQPKSVLLDVTDRKTILLPTDYVDWTKVAIKCGQYAVTMGVNDALATTDRNTTDTIIAGLLSQNLPNGLNFGNYGGYLFNNFGGGSLMSWGGGFVTKGSFKFRDAGLYKEILLDYDFNFTQVYLEYISDGFDPCGTTIVDPYFADYTKKGMEFSWEEEKEPNRTEASINRKGRDFRDAFKLVRARKNDLDPKTLINISRAGTRFTAKI